MSGTSGLGKALAFDVLLAVVAILGATSLAHVSRWLTVPFLLAWPIGLYLDLKSTRGIYHLSPEEFSRTELNKILAGLVDRFGFAEGVVAYIFLWEVPVFVFVSLSFLWFVAPYFPFMLELFPRLGGAAVGMGVVHVTAWRSNRKYVESQETTG